MRSHEPRLAECFYEIEGARAHNLKGVSARLPKGWPDLRHRGGRERQEQSDPRLLREGPPGGAGRGPVPGGQELAVERGHLHRVFDHIRAAFARATGAEPALFSFNSTGACPKCKGSGGLVVEMSFMDDVRTRCDECGSRRYRDAVLEWTYRERSIHDVLSMTIQEAAAFFTETRIRRPLATLVDVGLGYLAVGQPLSTLSGGEAQRLKLAKELHQAGNLYVMDEPTTGLHMADVGRLVDVMQRLVDAGNTVVVIEHNLDVVRQADWVVDLGPEGGAAGGGDPLPRAPRRLGRVPSISYRTAPVSCTC